jgi:signal transduction histidine kinase
MGPWTDAGTASGGYGVAMHTLRPPLFGRLRAGHWIAIDGLAAALLILVAVLLDQRAGGSGGESPADLLVAVLATVAAALRRRWSPRVLSGAVLAAALASALTGFPAVWLAVAYTMYYVPMQLPGREAMWLLAGTLLITVLGVANAVRLPLAGPGVPAAHRPLFTDPVELLVRSVLPITIGWTIGYAIRQQRMYAAQLRERADREAQDRLTEARRAMNEERLRIARELHDVVAHTLSVIAVQAGVANHVAGQRPDETQRALTSIEQTSRDALHEMRALLGVLREDDGTRRPAGPPTPVPGLADLTALVERSAEAGLRVDLKITGEPGGTLPTGVQLAVYRVVQEALTNVIKHAATDQAQVNVGYRVDAVTVEVTDRGAGVDTVTPGHGIAGMRERAGIYGGHLAAGPRTGGGFRVRATFPLGTGVPS